MKIYNFQNKGGRNLVGARIKHRREQLRLSQARLALKAQITGVVLEQDTISKIESGVRMVQDYELKAICEVLNVSADWLLDLHPENFIPLEETGKEKEHPSGNGAAQKQRVSEPPKNE